MNKDLQATAEQEQVEQRGTCNCYEVCLISDPRSELCTNSTRKERHTGCDYFTYVLGGMSL